MLIENWYGTIYANLFWLLSRRETQPMPKHQRVFTTQIVIEINSRKAPNYFSLSVHRAKLRKRHRLTQHNLNKLIYKLLIYSHSVRFLSILVLDYIVQ